MLVHVCACELGMCVCVYIYIYTHTCTQVIHKRCLSTVCVFYEDLDAYFQTLTHIHVHTHIHTGHTKAMFEYGMCLLRGLGYIPLYMDTHTHIHTGHTQAMFEHGMCLLRGLGCEASPQEGFACILESAQKNIKEAVYQVQGVSYMHRYTHTYIDTYMHTYTHTYIDTYMHTYTHTYIDTYMHT
jgi:hypothetical protein